MTDKETARALTEAIGADVRHRVDAIADQFIRDAFEAVPTGELPTVLHLALAEVSSALGEGLAAQQRELERPMTPESE